MRRLPLILVVTALVGATVALGAPRSAREAREAREAAQEDVDRLGLAAMLVRDARWERAAGVLAELDEADPALDRSAFHTLRGLVRFALEDWSGATGDFRAAIAAGQADPLIVLNLAQALIRSEDPEAALAALGAGGGAVAALPAAGLLEARALQMLRRFDAAFDVLARGAERFPERTEYGVQRILLMIELGLYQEARVQAIGVLSAGGLDAKTWALVGDTLRRAGQPREAIRLLEEGRLRYPGTLEILVPLAHAWLDDDHPFASGQVLQEAAVLDGRYAQESAEMFRRAGRIERALAMNALVADPREKARQRLGLLLDAEDWERAISLSKRLSRLGLLGEDSLRYALAYAAFRSGDVPTAESYLDGIADPKIFEDAIALRAAMADCTEGWDGCY